MSYVRCRIKDLDKLKKHLNQMKKAPQSVMKGISNDAKKRVPTWVAAEVSKVYGVKKAEIENNKIGKVSVRGEGIMDTAIIYSGRVLTPTHFSMAPTAPPEGKGYTLKASIIRGQRATLGKIKKLTKKQRAALGKNYTRSGSRRSNHSPIMLMYTGNTQEEGTDYIPFQRKSVNRKDVKAVKTVSLPQMVSSARTKPNIQRAIDEGLSKRLDHYIQRYMGK